MQLRMARPTQHHLVLLPGLDGTGRLFDPLISILPPTFEATVVRYTTDRPASERDLLGCIRSVIPWDHPYVIVAESSAGPLALKFVEVQRQNIRAVVLCGAFVTNPLATEPTDDPLKWATSFLTKSWLEKTPTAAILRKHFLGDDAPEVLVDRAALAFSSLTPELWSARVQAVLKADARQLLKSCDKPILHLQPATDQFVSKAAAAEISRLNPLVKTVVVRGPHAVLQRNPQEALEAIRAFLDQLPGS